MTTLALMVFAAAIGMVVGIGWTYAIMRHAIADAYDSADAYAEGVQAERDSAGAFDSFGATALAPLPAPDGFSEPEQEWDDDSLAALAGDSQPHRFAPDLPDARPAELERLPVPHDLTWPDDPELAGKLALLDAQESVSLAAAARLRAQLTDSIPVVRA
jgi:hypothetical protein